MIPHKVRGKQESGGLGSTYRLTMGGRSDRMPVGVSGYKLHVHARNMHVYGSIAQENR